MTGTSLYLVHHPLLIYIIGGKLCHYKRNTNLSAESAKKHLELRVVIRGGRIKVAKKKLHQILGRMSGAGRDGERLKNPACPT